MARPLPLILDELAASGRLSWELIARGEHTAKVPSPTDDPDAAPDTTQFSEQDREQIRDTLAALATHGGKSISDWSHEESAGWNMVREDGREIPYGTVYISTEPITEETLIRARQFLQEEGIVS